MNTQFRVLLLGILLLSVGCTKGAPSFTTLDESSVPQPTFGSGQTSTSINVSSSAAEIPIAGDCDPKITDLIAVPVAGNSSMSIATMVKSGSLLVECSTNGHFSFTLTSLTALGFSLVSGQTFDVQVRGVTSGGISRASVIHLNYAPYEREKVLITSGSTENLDTGNPRLASSASFKAQIRLGHFSNNALTNMNEALVKSSTTYKFKGGVAGAISY